MSESSPQHVTIIGAGVVGICSALSLRERGYSVDVFDRDPPARGASYGNAGVISPWSCVPQSVPGLWRQVPGWMADPQGPVTVRWRYAMRFLPWAMKFLRAGQAHRLPAIGDAMNALNRPNVTLYRQHLAGTGSEHLITDSNYVHVYKNADAIQKSQLGWRMRSERDVPQEIIDQHALQEIEPDLSTDYKAAIVLKGQARALSPGAVGEALATKAQRMGARFHQVKINRILPESASGSWTIDTDTGPRQASHLLIAAGAWSARLLAPLGVHLPLEAERGYHIVLKNPGVTLNNSIMEIDRKFVASSMHAGIRCAGTAEFAGLDAKADFERARVFKDLARSLLPKINVDDCEEWMGSRPSFPDSLPCIGEVPGHNNLFAAFGHSHFGFGMAPKTGDVIANVISGAPVDVDLNPYRLDRFR